MIGQGSTQTSSPPGQPPFARTGSDANITALACAPFDRILSPPLPASNSGDHRRPAAKAPHPTEVLKCPRCDSLDTKFCYYNNYSLTQPRYFCKNCKRYWTAGGALRNVPVGGGLRKNKRSKLKLAAAAADAEAALAAQALAATGQPQQHQAKAAGEAPQIVDNRISSAPANPAMPSHLAVVGVPELGMYAHSGGVSSSKPHMGEDLSDSASPYVVKHMVDQNGAHTAAPTLPQQGGHFYGKDETSANPTFFCDPTQVPQFYSSYAANLPIQYGNAAVPGGAVPGYAVNYNFFTTDPNGNALNDECGNASLGATDHSRGDVKQDKGGEVSTNAYDWQLMSEGIFNGTVASDSSFLYAPSSSWPDFSQFNDPGPG